MTRNGTGAGDPRNNTFRTSRSTVEKPHNFFGAAPYPDQARHAATDAQLISTWIRLCSDNEQTGLFVMS